MRAVAVRSEKQAKQVRDGRRIEPEFANSARLQQTCNSNVHNAVPVSVADVHKSLPSSAAFNSFHSPRHHNIGPALLS